MTPQGPIRVLHLRDSPWVDGPGRTILETASRIDRSRIDYQVGVFVVTPGQNHPMVEELRLRQLPVHEVVDDGSSLGSVVKRVIEMIDSLGIEVLHSSEFRSNVIATMCGRRRPVRLVSTAHGWIANDLRGKVRTLVDRFLLRGFDRVILVSYAMRRRLPPWWVPDRRLHVLHNALVFERFGANPLKPRRPAPDAARNITLLNVGRLSAEKGQALLIRAVAALNTMYPKLSLKLVGVGPLESELQGLSMRLGIAERVIFVGYVSDMTPVYDSADLVIQSSFTEGLPNVILEAAFLGLPIVATDVGGTAEVIEHGVSGWLIRPRSLGQLISGIKHFLENPEHFSEMTLAARMRVEKNFSFDARTARQTQLYLELARTPA